MRGSRSVARIIMLVLPTFAAACETTTTVELPDVRISYATVPSQDDAAGLDAATWNIEWFGSTTNGPTDEALQLQNVKDVIAGTNIDIWGLQEIVDTVHFRNLMNNLPGYAALVANDPKVTNGPQYYSGFSNTEQKVALLYRTSAVTLVSAKVILTANDFDFAGRPPVEYQVRVAINGTTRDMVIIVLHAKAGADSDSHARRTNASIALKSYLDTTYPTQNVLIIGDFNDDVDTSILADEPSPYANFVNDAVRYVFPTKALSDARISTTTGYPDAVDHQLNTNEVHATYVSGSAKAYRVDSYIANYSTTTTDHYPVLARYTFSSGGSNTPPTAAFSYSCSNLSCTFTDGSTDADGTIASWSWNFGDNSTSTVQHPTRTFAAAGTYNVTLTVTDNGGASGTTSKSVSVGSTPANVTINEILANEPGSSTSGEAVELVNIGGTAADIGGWTISDASRVRHTFAAGTSLQPGKAIAVYGGASAIPAGIVAVAASTGTLGLANKSDSVILKNASGVTVQSFTYGSSLASQDGVSMNRSPDASGTGSFVLHTSLSTLGESIGKRATGSAW